MGFNIRNDQIEALLRTSLKAFKQLLPTGWGATVLIFNYGEGKAADEGLFYGSTANRDDMIAAMKEFIRKNEH
jgi:hypothetical protein